MRLAALLPVILALAIPACKNRPARVVVGVAVSVSTHPGVVLAAREINNAGGVAGVPLELMGLEWKDQAGPVEILTWANRFADNKDLLAVIGHSDSAATLSAAAVYNQKKVPQIVTIATNPAITNIGVWTYRLCLSDAVQGPALAEYAVHDWGKKRVAIFYVNDAYGRGLSELFERRLRELGGDVVSSVMHRNVLRPDDKDLINLTLKDLREQKPDLIVLFQRVPAAQWTISAIREVGIKSDILGGDSLGTIDFLRSTRQSEGMRLSQFFLSQSGDQRSAEFARAIHVATGVDADYGRALAYDALYLIRDAVAGGGYSREGVKAHLDRLIREKRVIRGAGGAYALGPDHDARRSLYLVEVLKGSHHLLKTLKAPELSE